MTTTMTYPDLASRDEYLDQKLRTAARVMWLALGDVEGNTLPLEPTATWIEREAGALRAMLFTGGQSEHRYRELRAYVLRLLGISQSYASSSLSVEQAPAAVVPKTTESDQQEPAEPFTESDRQAAEAEAMRDWVRGGPMRPVR